MIGPIRAEALNRWTAALPYLESFHGLAELNPSAGALNQAYPESGLNDGYADFPCS